MKAFNMSPVDPQVRKMNIFQWLWSYYNIVKDDEEEQDIRKIHYDRLAFIANPEMAKSVFEHEERLVKKGKNGKRDSRPIGSSSFNPDEGVHQNDDFELELIAAAKGYSYDEHGISPREFLEQLESKKEVDIFNDSFDDLLASGEFHEVVDTSKGAGDPTETSDDFISRVMQFQGVADESLESKDEKEKENYSEEDMKSALEKLGLTEEDLDIFETYDDE